MATRQSSEHYVPALTRVYSGLEEWTYLLVRVAAGGERHQRIDGAMDHQGGRAHLLREARGALGQHARQILPVQRAEIARRIVDSMEQ